MYKHMPKVLVIEDAEALLKVWSERFKKQGFKVLAASDGNSAILAAVEDHPDLVVVDLPQSEGEAVVKKLREYKWASRVPVMFLNSWQDPEVFTRYSLGLDDHLAYNWSLKEVVERAKNKLARSYAF